MIQSGLSIHKCIKKPPVLHPYRTGGTPYHEKILWKQHQLHFKGRCFPHDALITTDNELLTYRRICCCFAFLQITEQIIRCVVVRYFTKQSVANVNDGGVNAEMSGKDSLPKGIGDRMALWMVPSPSSLVRKGLAAERHW